VRAGRGRKKGKQKPEVIAEVARQFCDYFGLSPPD